jgi:hypothetical protein
VTLPGPKPFERSESYLIERQNEKKVVLGRRLALRKQLRISLLFRATSLELGFQLIVRQGRFDFLLRTYLGT